MFAPVALVKLGDMIANCFEPRSEGMTPDDGAQVPFLTSNVNLHTTKVTAPYHLGVLLEMSHFQVRASLTATPSLSNGLPSEQRPMLVHE